MKQKPIDKMTLQELDEFQDKGREVREAELYSQLCNYHWRHFHDELEDGGHHTSDASRKFANDAIELLEHLINGTTIKVELELFYKLED